MVHFTTRAVVEKDLVPLDTLLGRNVIAEATEPGLGPGVDVTASRDAVHLLISMNGGDRAGFTPV